MNEMERSQLEAAMEDAREQFTLAALKFGEVVQAAVIFMAPKLAKAGRELNAALDVERRALGFQALGVDPVEARDLAVRGFEPSALAALRDFVDGLSMPAAVEPIAAPAPPRNENPKRKRWESTRWQPKGRR
jgi:hypothetical protein